MATPRLFDASTVVDILLGESGSDVDVSIVFDQYLLDLTLYESANALWKIGLAHDRLTDDDLEEAVGLLERLRYEVELESVTEDELVQTMQVARDTGLTFYDAAYLATAERRDLTLVTEDEALRNAALNRNIAADTVADL